MKRNVDLTEDEVFSRNRLGTVRFENRVPHFSISKYPWYHHMGENSLEQQWIDKDTWGIYQGNGNNRFTKRVCYEQDFGMGIYCDCCGRKLYPWDKQQCLCSRCQTRMDDIVDSRKDVFIHE